MGFPIVTRAISLHKRQVRLPRENDADTIGINDSTQTKHAAEVQSTDES